MRGVVLKLECPRAIAVQDIREGNIESLAIVSIIEFEKFYVNVFSSIRIIYVFL